MSEPVFMAQIRAADIPESMPVSRAIRDFMVAHPPTPEGQPTGGTVAAPDAFGHATGGPSRSSRAPIGSRHRVSESAGRDLPKTELVPPGRWRRRAALCRGGPDAPRLPTAGAACTLRA